MQDAHNISYIMVTTEKIMFTDGELQIRYIKDASQGKNKNNKRYQITTNRITSKRKKTVLNAII